MAKLLPHFFGPIKFIVNETEFSLRGGLKNTLTFYVEAIAIKYPVDTRLLLQRD